MGISLKMPLFALKIDRYNIRIYMSMDQSCICRLTKSANNGIKLSLKLIIRMQFTSENIISIFFIADTQTRHP